MAMFGDEQIEQCKQTLFAVAKAFSTERNKYEKSIFFLERVNFTWRLGQLNSFRINVRNLYDTIRI